MAVLKWSLLRAAFHFYLPYMSHAISRQLYLNEISPMSHQSDHSFLNMINTRNIRRRYVWMGPSRFFPFWCSTWFLPCVKWRVIGHHKDLRARWTRRSVLRQLPGDRATLFLPCIDFLWLKKNNGMLRIDVVSSTTTTLYNWFFVPHAYLRNILVHFLIRLSINILYSCRRKEVHRSYLQLCPLFYLRKRGSKISADYLFLFLNIISYSKMLERIN